MKKSLELREKKIKKLTKESFEFETTDGRIFSDEYLAKNWQNRLNILEFFEKVKSRGIRNYEHQGFKILYVCKVESWDEYNAILCKQENDYRFINSKEGFVPGVYVLLETYKTFPKKMFTSPETSYALMKIQDFMQGLEQILEHMKQDVNAF